MGQGMEVVRSIKTGGYANVTKVCGSVWSNMSGVARVSMIEQHGDDLGVQACSCPPKGDCQAVMLPLETV
jgi:hypothetical protein